MSGGLPRELWLKMGAAGFLCPWLQSEYGGPALSFAFRAAAAEPIRLGAPTTLSIFQGDEMLKSATMAVWQILGPEAFPTGAADFSTGLLLAKASFRVIIENRIHYILW